MQILTFSDCFGTTTILAYQEVASSTQSMLPSCLALVQPCPKFAKVLVEEYIECKVWYMVTAG